MVSDITSHFSQKAVLHFPRSNRNISDYIYVNILGLLRLPSTEHQIFCCSKSLGKLFLHTRNFEKTVSANRLLNSASHRHVSIASAIFIRLSYWNANCKNCIRCL